MKENVSGYSRNPCSLNRERDAAFAAKLLTLPTGFFSAEKSEEWMARSPVWPDDVIASETASRHQPMNWRDSIWAQTRSRGRRSRCVKLATQRLVPYSENKGYASNPRRFSVSKTMLLFCIRNFPTSSHTRRERMFHVWEVRQFACTRT